MVPTLKKSIVSVIIILFLALAIQAGAGEAPALWNIPAEKIAGLASKALFVQEGDPTCALKYFDTLQKRIVTVMVPKSCPKEMYVADEKSSVILVMAKTLQEIKFGEKVEIGPPISLPEPKVKKDNFPAEVAYAGYRPDGRLLLIMESWYPWDDLDLYRYEYEKNRWVFKEEKLCGKSHECEYYPPLKRPEGAAFWGKK